MFRVGWSYVKGVFILFSVRNILYKELMRNEISDHLGIYF